ncbi:hypothetical protein PENTCL1PPCAC_454 [Pristionchus entomophagus]|uniref:Ribosomal protein n=1 Tax=Pristionchus entomophagus TaxID=358040 RepID=A0AAV5SE20_9BILA|nr:hypothetical protein PENTCL1PPCAC_454 [Pristionchus entomophagus]
MGCLQTRERRRRVDRDQTLVRHSSRLQVTREHLCRQLAVLADGRVKCVRLRERLTLRQRLGHVQIEGNVVVVVQSRLLYPIGEYIFDRLRPAHHDHLFAREFVASLQKISTFCCR